MPFSAGTILAIVAMKELNGKENSDYQGLKSGGGLFWSVVGTTNFFCSSSSVVCAFITID